MRILVLLFFVSAHCYAAHAPSGHWYAAAMDEDDAQRLEVIERLHEDKPCYCMPANYACLCCASDASKQRLNELYYEGGPWDATDASKAKKTLVWCRRKGCGVEHVCGALSCVGTGVITTAPLITHAAYDASVVMPAIAEVLGGMYLCVVPYTKWCDEWLSKPGTWQNSNTHLQMSEEDEADRDILVAALSSGDEEEEI